MSQNEIYLYLPYQFLPLLVSFRPCMPGGRRERISSFHYSPSSIFSFHPFFPSTHSIHSFYPLFPSTLTIDSLNRLFPSVSWQLSFPIWILIIWLTHLFPKTIKDSSSLRVGPLLQRTARNDWWGDNEHHRNGGGNSPSVMQGTVNSRSNRF